jgi:hypothetical protein
VIVSPRLALVAVTAGACASGEARRPEPPRDAEGLPVTGRAPYDAHFQQVRRLDADARALSAQSEALTGPIAVALELPLAAPPEDLAAALGKSVKRCARLGVAVRIVLDPSPAIAARIETSGGDVPAALLPGFEAVTAAIAAARALRPSLLDATRRAETLHAEGERLTQTSAADFARRGPSYSRAVARELADARQQVDQARAALRQAEARVRDVLERLPAAAPGPAGRVRRVTPGLTSR